MGWLLYLTLWTMIIFFIIGIVFLPSLKELNRLNLESSNSKYSLNTDSSVSYIDSSVISPDSIPLGTGGSLLSKQVQNKPKSGRCLLGGTATLSPLTPR